MVFLEKKTVPVYHKAVLRIGEKKGVPPFTKEV